MSYPQYGERGLCEFLLPLGRPRLAPPACVHPARPRHTLLLEPNEARSALPRATRLASLGAELLLRQWLVLPDKKQCCALVPLMRLLHNLLDLSNPQCGERGLREFLLPLGRPRLAPPFCAQLPLEVHLYVRLPAAFLPRATFAGFLGLELLPRHLLVLPLKKQCWRPVVDFLLHL